MRFSHFFIRRPIFAAVLSILTVLVGGMALWRLPIASYPEVVPPTVFVMASYPGASADTVAATVSTPVEQEINGVENMLYMSSSCSSDGQMRLQVTFKTGTDLDTAQVQVQNRVAVALPRLPEEVRRLGVTVRKRSPSMTMIVNLISPEGKYDDIYLNNYAYLQLKDVLARLPGVGEAMILGLRDYSMRIWIDPDKASARDLTASEIVAAIREQNVQVAAGTFGQPPQPRGLDFQLVARTQGRLSTAEQFGDIVLKTGGEGQITRLRDVARIELGAKDYSVDAYLDGVPAAALAITQLPGSNAIETANAVRAAMAQLSKRFPAGLKYEIAFDTTQFIRESIREVIKTLLIALGLVTLVVILFLQTWRASLIPLLAVPVSLIGTFAAMRAFGFSINNLTLFGLVLAIGIVVDDAIVVVENVERHIARGLSPVAATQQAMAEVSSAVVAIALVLSAVFIPTAFVSGLPGKFYQQFALTIAVSTLISAFNSLTLSPALCALLLQPHHAPKDIVGRLLHGAVAWLFRGFNRVFEGSRARYLGALHHVLRHGAIALVLYAGLLGLTWFGFQRVPTGFIPDQDKGYLIAYLQLPDGASLERTAAVSGPAARLIQETAGVAHVIKLDGFSIISFGTSGNAATMFIRLKPFSERVKAGQTANRILGELRGKLAGIQEGFMGVFGAPPVDGLGSLGGFKVLVEDRTALGFQALQTAAQQLMMAANQDKRLAGALTTFRANVPQVYLDVDRAKAKSMRVPLNTVWDTLQVYLGSLYVNDFNVFGRPFQVTAQADAPFRARPGDVTKLKVRNEAGQMVPLGTIVTLRDTTAPVVVNRYNMYNAAELSGNTAPGVSSGEAIRIMEDLANRILPPGMAIEWTELSLLEILAGNSAVFIFPLCVLMVFLVLAAQYESWSLPLAIVLIVPMCLLFAIAGVWARGLDNNLFTQIGLVVLMGLACKNAILIVEFAKQIQDAGQPRLAAALEASRLRLRPILMTSLAFTFGVIPLMLSHGAGAEMRRAIGTAVFFGMLGVTFFGIFLTPVFYVVIRRVLEGKQGAADAAAVSGGKLSGASALLLVGLGAAWLWGGCVAGPEHRVPRTQVSSSFANASQTNWHPLPTAVRWWRGFNDATLDRLIEQAVATNQDLRLAAARVREARALHKVAVLQGVPQVAAVAGYNQSLSSRDAIPFGDLPRSSRELALYDAGFDASWELDLFGRVTRSVEASTAEVEAFMAQRQEILVSLIAELARNYIELRGAQQELDVARQNAANQAETAEIILARLKAGRATELDAARVRTQLNATRALIPPLEANVKQTIYRLSVLAGQAPTTLEPELAKPSPLPVLPSFVSLGSPDALLRRRPDIRAAERALAAATARVGVETANLFPRVTFNGNLGVSASEISGLFKAGADTYAFGPRISWAALDFGRLRARLQAAGARAEAQLARYEKTVLLALEETEDALVAFGKAKARHEYLEAANRDAAAAVTLALQRYKSGIEDFLSVLDAQRTQLTVQEQCARSETQTAAALVAVYKALGGGWELEVSPGARSANGP
jgi:multidrug efflux pump